jgi:hypothetical protein
MLVTSAPVSRRLIEGLLRAGRSAVVLVALLAVFELTSVAHHHSSPTEERSCTACQISRDGDGSLKGTTPADLPRPEGVAVTVHLVSPDVAGLRTHAGPLPSRGPPPVSPAEQL